MVTKRVPFGEPNVPLLGTLLEDLLDLVEELLGNDRLVVAVVDPFPADLPDVDRVPEHVEDHAVVPGLPGTFPPLGPPASRQSRLPGTDGAHRRKGGQAVQMGTLGSACSPGLTPSRGSLECWSSWGVVVPSEQAGHPRSSRSGCELRRSRMP
jgi:hypothetical protein